MIIIKDEYTKRAYKLISNELFYTPLFNDGMVDEQGWEIVEVNSTTYHLDLIKKLSSLNQISASISRGILDDCLG
tara:strand:+ start:310 stop:534 length:225 start_codon:yes stop_codon:yes gene_type:complete